MPEERTRTVTLGTLANGAADVQFLEEWEKVLKNIADPNADPRKVREINIKIRIKPDEDRRMGAVDVGTTSRLAPTKKKGTAVHFHRHKGELVATEYNPDQGELDLEPESSTAAPSATAPSTTAAPAPPASAPAAPLRAIQGGQS